MFNQSLVEELRENFFSKMTTKTYEWRAGQLRKMIEGVKALEKEFSDAIMADLGKCPEANAFEMALVIAACEHDLKHLKEWMRDIHTETELLLAPGRTSIHYEPLGVVAVYSAWNYPVILALKPVA